MIFPQWLHRLPWLTPVSLALMLTAGLPSAAEAQDSEALDPQDSTPVVDLDAKLTDLQRAQQMFIRVESAVDTMELLIERFTGTTADERAILRSQGRRQLEVVSDIQPDLLKVLSKLESNRLDQDSLAIDSLHANVTGVLTRQYFIYSSGIEWYSRLIDDLRSQRDTAPPDKVGDVETQIQEGRKRLDLLITTLSDILRSADNLRIDTKPGWEEFDRLVRDRAEILVGRLQLAVNLKKRLKTQISDATSAQAPESEISAFRTQQQVTERRIQGIVGSLSETSRLLDSRGYETTQYRQIMIQATGDITEDILNVKVAVGLLKDLVRDAWAWFKAKAPAMIVKLLILIGTVLLFRIVFRLLWWIFRLLGLVRVSKLMLGLMSTLVRPVATISGLVTGLWFLGVDPTTLLTGVGVLGIIIGLALQDSLSNLAAGMFILATRPYDVDDVVVAGGELGTVKAMGLANSTIVTFDNRRILVPNKKIWGDKIENRSAEPIRRVDASFKVGFSENMERVYSTLHDLMKSDERILDDPRPYIYIEKVDESWLQLAVRPWVKNSDWWHVLTELPHLIHARFEKEGISVPYPQRVLTHPDTDDAPSAA